MSYIPMNIYEIIIFCARVYLFNWHLNLFMDIHYFFCNKTGYLAIFIKYTFSEKNKILQHFKVYQSQKGFITINIRYVISLSKCGLVHHLSSYTWTVKWRNYTKHRLTAYIWYDNCKWSGIRHYLFQHIFAMSKM